jgi:hypothetical protein
VPPPPVCGATVGYGVGLGDAVGDGLTVGDGLGDTVVVGVGVGLTLGEASRDAVGETVDDPLGCGEDGGSAAELLEEQAARAAQVSNASAQQRAAASITRILVLDAAACAFMEPLLVRQQVAARFGCEGP